MSSSRQAATSIESKTLPLDRQAVSQLLSLPMHHRDPFDRMLICQALKDDLTIVTTDEWFKGYAAKLLTA